MSTRKQIRAKRRQEQQRRRMITIGVVAGAAVLVAAFLIILNRRPIGAIAEVETRDVQATSDGLTLGDPNAPIVLEEYGDFQCPHCQDWFLNVEPLLVDNYVETGKVYFIYRNFPILGPESVAAANASMCAAEQDRFWDYHDMLFANLTGRNSGGFSTARLVAFAETLGLDAQAFRECLESQRYQDQVDQDFREGQRVGVPGTPGIVINGQLMENTSYGFLQQRIDALLAGGN